MSVLVQDALSPGTLFANRYRLLSRIGAGGFGAVYDAVHVITERRVAVKALWPHIAHDPQFRSRFLSESRLAAQVGSEFIVDVLDAGVDESTDVPFLVMELLKGENLNDRSKRKHRFTPRETIAYLSQVAVALERTHERGIVHRDLKPANLFLTERSDGSPLIKVLDFGIAKLLGSTGLEASQALGTPLYMAPEQFTQSAALPSADVYALGMIAFRFLTGLHYYALERAALGSAYALAPLLCSGPPEPARLRARRYGVELPRGFDAWFGWLTHPDPKQRCAAPRAALIALCGVFGIPPRPPLVTTGRKKLVGALSFAIEGKRAPAPSFESPPLEPTLDMTPPPPAPAPVRRSSWPMVGLALAAWLVLGATGAGLLVARGLGDLKGSVAVDLRPFITPAAAKVERRALGRSPARNRASAPSASSGAVAPRP